jgi:hypothetical protein
MVEKVNMREKAERAEEAEWAKKLNGLFISIRSLSGDIEVKRRKYEKR